MICCVIAMSDNFGKRTRAISLLIAAIIATSIISQNDYIGINAIENLYENNKDHILFDLLTIVGAIGFIVIPIIGIIPAIMLVFFVIDKIQKKKLFVSLLKNSKLCPGCVMYFDVKYSGSMTMGFFTADIISHFDDYPIKSKHYNDAKQCGTLSGKDASFGLRWNIPDDLIPGKCKVIIKARCTMKLFGFFFPVSYTLKEQELECMIYEMPQYNETF